MACSARIAFTSASMSSGVVKKPGGHADRRPPGDARTRHRLNPMLLQQGPLQLWAVISLLKL